MKKILRYALLLAVMTLAFAPVFTTNAQGCPEGLSADDCALLDAAGKANVTSFTIDAYTVKLNVKGIPGSEMSADISGTGGMDLSKMASFDPAKLAESLKDAVIALTADVKATQAGTEQASGLEVRIVEGVVYVKVSQMGDKWYKADLAAVLANSSSAGIDMGTFEGLAGSTGMMDGLGNIPGLITGSAADGEDIAGVKTRAITINVNLGAFVSALSDPTASAGLLEVLKQAGLPVDDSMLQQLTMVAAMLKPVFDNTKISLTQYIGTETKMLHGFDVNVSVKLDATSAAMLGAPSPVDFEFAFTIRMSKLGEGFTVEPVADAAELPLNN
ncbi:hypothetical protein ANRL4_00257 [Anaerolineae bacterium]|nr:hypothetical protein ANRL4_00257 [Anaerolineae bacterium]